MSKYNDWTRGETEAILNIIGGTEIARAVLRGERNLIITNPPLVGTVVKTLSLKPIKIGSINDAINLGKYSQHNTDIIKLYADDVFSFDEEVCIDLVRFDRGSCWADVWCWIFTNKRHPMLSKHLYAIGIQYPEEQRNALIAELGSSRRGDFLCLYGSSDSRCLGRYNSFDQKDHLFGFINDRPASP